MAYEFKGKEVESGIVKFNVVGDYLVATKGNVKQNIPTKVGEANLYECVAKAGNYHAIVTDEAIEVQEGEAVGFFAKPDSILDGKMQKIKTGQIFKIELTALKESKFGVGHEQKIYSVQQGPMDEVVGEEVQ